jgi:hypothetical protein
LRRRRDQDAAGDDVAGAPAAIDASSPSPTSFEVALASALAFFTVSAAEA